MRLFEAMNTPESQADIIVISFKDTGLSLSNAINCGIIHAQSMIDEHFGADGEYSTRRYYYWKNVKRELERKKL